MASPNRLRLRLRIKGFSKIGKLTLWHRLGVRPSVKILININHQARSLKTKAALQGDGDLTYGWLRRRSLTDKVCLTIKDHPGWITVIGAVLCLLWWFEVIGREAGGIALVLWVLDRLRKPVR